MKAIYKKRLLKLADFLYNNVSTRNFDLASYTDYPSCKYREDNDDVWSDLNPDKLASGLKNKDCGTTACALGWSPIVFPRQLKYDCGGMPAVKDEKRYGYGDIVHTFFGVHDGGFSYLFVPEAYRPGHRGPKSVANRIRKYVESNGQVPSYKTYPVG